MRSLRVLASSLAINFAYTSPSSIYSWHCVLNARSLDRIFASSVPCFLRFGRRVCVLPSASFPLPHPSPSSLSLFLRFFLDVSLSLSLSFDPSLHDGIEGVWRTNGPWIPGSLAGWDHVPRKRAKREMGRVEEGGKNDSEKMVVWQAIYCFREIGIH